MPPYALHADSDLDAGKIYRNPSSNPELGKNVMSVAGKLKAGGRVEDLWIGKIQTLEEFLDLPLSSTENPAPWHRRRPSLAPPTASGALAYFSRLITLEWSCGGGL